MGRGVGCSVNVVAHGGQESALVSHFAEELVEQCGNSCLSVGTCHSHEFQLLCGVAVEGGCQLSGNCLAVGNFQVGNLGINVLGQCLADDGCGSLLLGSGYIFVSIDLGAAHSDKHVSFLHLSRVDVNSCNVGLVFGKNQLYELYVSC